MTSQLYAQIATERSQASSAGGAMADSSPQLPTSDDVSSPAPSEPTGYRSLTLRIVGAAPLVMHSGVLANPLSVQAKELRRISKKRAKTDADIEYMAKVEWMGGLWAAEGVPCIPGEAIEAVFVQAAKKSKRGAAARAGMLSPGNWPLEYDGPRNLAALWEDERFRLSVGVRVGQARVMRMRPLFRKWAAEVTIEYLDDQLDERDVIDIMTVAGRLVGVGDWRPRFGRFEIESLRRQR